MEYMALGCEENDMEIDIICTYLGMIMGKKRNNNNNKLSVESQCRVKSNYPSLLLMQNFLYNFQSLSVFLLLLGFLHLDAAKMLFQGRG